MNPQDLEHGAEARIKQIEAGAAALVAVLKADIDPADHAMHAAGVKTLLVGFLTDIHRLANAAEALTGHTPANQAAEPGPRPSPPPPPSQL